MSREIDKMMADLASKMVEELLNDPKCPEEIKASVRLTKAAHDVTTIAREVMQTTPQKPSPSDAPRLKADADYMEMVLDGLRERFKEEA